MQPLTNAIKVGDLSENVMTYLKKKGIAVGKPDIELTYGDLWHSVRDSKKEAQKISKEQAKRAVNIISQNNVFYDTEKKNIIYISALPPKEIINGRNCLKIPININDKDEKNHIATMSIIPLVNILNSSQYEKID